jgi:hypothetical protein
MNLLPNAVLLVVGLGLAPFVAAQNRLAAPGPIAKDPTVSMSVRTSYGKVGAVGDAFDCLPLAIDAAVGTVADVEVYGSCGTFFALFVSLPTTACVPIPGIEGALALGQPIYSLAFGGIYDFQYDPNYPGIGYGAYSYVVPPLAPFATDLRLQAVSFAPAGQGLAFGRAVQLHLL